MAYIFHVITICMLIEEVFSHGYMFTPINRASRWRLDKDDETIPHCYDDNQFYCGGLIVQYSSNEGKCGVCGDDYGDPVPRSNENGGSYGNGVVVENYYVGELITVDIRLTANHIGNMSYSLCKLENPDLPENEECFQPLTLENGAFYQNVEATQFNITSAVQLPSDVICDRCVFRWQYVAGNNWGSCGDGTSAEGCGPQETFRSCADISITDS